MIILILILIVIIVLILLFKCILKKKSHFENTPFPIDIVYTWAGEFNDDNNIRESYNNELKYSLRSVFKYMPWFNKIYIIINSPIKKNFPTWFNEKYKKDIIILDQKSIFPKDKHHLLPCKVSDIIESYLTNIPNLSEHFIYLNDDFFINKKITFDTFYDLNENKILLPNSVKNNRNINFNNKLGFKKYPKTNKKNGRYFPHIPYYFTKTSYNNFLNEYHEYINWIREFSYKKRINIKDCKNYDLYSPCHHLHYSYRIFLLKNNLGKISKINETVIIGNKKILLLLQIFLFTKLFNNKFFTINNLNKNNKDIATNFLQKKYPDKLYFEK